jgi:hypothetical protein
VRIFGFVDFMPKDSVTRLQLHPSTRLRNAAVIDFWIQASHRARPSFFRAFREPLRALLDGGANGRKLSSGGAKACDEMQNLFEEDGAIEIAVQHAEIAKFPIMRIVI